MFKDGKPITMAINEELYNALKPSQRYDFEETLIGKILQKPSQWQRNVLTTKNPIFALTNAVKDIQTAIINSKDTSKMLKNYARVVAHIAKQKIINPLTNQNTLGYSEIQDYWDLYLANGGESNTYFDYEKGATVSDSPKTFKQKVFNIPKKILNKIEAVNEIIEQAPRVAEFITTIENGGTINEAMYNAADVTTNFKRGGDFTKMLNRNGANFLNASIQGLDKQIRNFTEGGIKGAGKMIVKSVLLGIAPAIINHLLLSDDDDYEDLPDYIKDNYWLFKIGDDKFIRIPKGRDIPTFIGNLASRTTRLMQGDERAFEGIVDTFMNSLAPNNPLEDNIFAPWVAVKTNKSWNGSNIVSSSLENKILEQQYDAKTTEFSKWLGKKIHYSPKKIDYLLDQYSGGIGDVFMPMNTKYAEENNALSSKFVTDSINNNKNVSIFYDLQEELTKKKNSDMVSDIEIYQLKYLSDINKKMSELYKEKREVESSDLNNKEKKEEANRIQKEINTLSKNAINTYKAYGDQASEYLKDDAFVQFVLKGSKEDASEETKQNNLEKVVKAYTDKDIFGAEYALLEYNKDISEKQKEAEKLGIDDEIFFKAYFAQKNITSDKNWQGKTISGSKAKKQIEAINSAVGDDLTLEQKKRLYGIFNIAGYKE